MTHRRYCETVEAHAVPVRLQAGRAAVFGPVADARQRAGDHARHLAGQRDPLRAVAPLLEVAPVGHHAQVRLHQLHAARRHDDRDLRRAAQAGRRRQPGAQHHLGRHAGRDLERVSPALQRRAARVLRGRGGRPDRQSARRRAGRQHRQADRRRCVHRIVDDDGNDVPKDANGERTGELLFRHADGTPVQGRVLRAARRPARRNAPAAGCTWATSCARTTTAGCISSIARAAASGATASSSTPPSSRRRSPRPRTVDDVYVYGIPAANGVPGEKDVVAAVVPKNPDLAAFDVQGLFRVCRQKLEPELRAELHPGAAPDPEDRLGEAAGPLPGRGPRRATPAPCTPRRAESHRIPLRSKQRCHPDARSSSTAPAATPAS